MFQALLTIIISAVTFVWRFPPRVVWMPQVVSIQAPAFPLLAAPAFSPVNATTPTRPNTDLVVRSRVDPPPNSATPFLLVCVGLVCLALVLRLRRAAQPMKDDKIVPPPAREGTTLSQATQTALPVTTTPFRAPDLAFSTIMHTQFRAVAPSFLSIEQVRIQVAGHQFRAVELEIDLGTKQTELNEALYTIRRLEKKLKKHDIDSREDHYFSDSDEAEAEAKVLRTRIMARQNTHCATCHRRLQALLPGLCHVCNARKPIEPTFASAFEDLNTRRRKMFKLRRDDLLAGPSPPPTPVPTPTPAPKPALLWTPTPRRKFPGSFEASV